MDKVEICRDDLKVAMAHAVEDILEYNNPEFSFFVTVLSMNLCYAIEQQLFNQNED